MNEGHINLMSVSSSPCVAFLRQAKQVQSKPKTYRKETLKQKIINDGAEIQ
jgi:hypothetical protein